MTAYAPASRPASPLPLALLLLALVAAAVAAIAPAVDVPAPEPELTDEQIYRAVVGGVIVDPSYSHAADEHPEDMPTVRRCLGDGGTWKQVYRTPQPNRYLRVCFDGKDVVFQIIDNIRGRMWEKTAYIRDELRSITDVVKYVDRVNYYRVKVLLP